MFSASIFFIFLIFVDLLCPINNFFFTLFILLDPKPFKLLFNAFILVLDLVLVYLFIQNSDIGLN